MGFRGEGQSLGPEWSVRAWGSRVVGSSGGIDPPDTSVLQIPGLSGWRWGESGKNLPGTVVPGGTVVSGYRACTSASRFRALRKRASTMRRAALLISLRVFSVISRWISERSSALRSIGVAARRIRTACR